MTLTQYRGKNVLITGGLGMIGSTIAVKLVPLGARVTIVDACLAPYGANMFNVSPVQDQVDVIRADIRDQQTISELVRGRDIIFNLAGQVSHNDSLEDPFLDASINYIGHLNVLESVRRNAPESVVLHAGSRLQYGRIQRLPVAEDHPLRPLTPYALNKTAAENMYLFYHRIHGISVVAFRIANPYGPRAQMKHSKYAIVNWFIRQAMEDRTITVFGEGKQLRDYIFVEDLADAFIAAAINPACYGKVFNVGSGKGTAFGQMAEEVVNVVGAGRVEYVPWPENYVNVETGDYVADITRIQQATGWQPTVDLTTGIRKTVAYYSRFRAHYW